MENMDKKCEGGMCGKGSCGGGMCGGGSCCGGGMCGGMGGCGGHGGKHHLIKIILKIIIVILIFCSGLKLGEQIGFIRAETGQTLRGSFGLNMMNRYGANVPLPGVINATPTP